MNRWFFALLISLSFILSQTAHALEFLTQSKLVELAKKAKTDVYPDSEEVLLDNYIQVNYQPDGTSETWDDTALKILTEKGKRNNRSLSLNYNTSYGTNGFFLVQIIKADGSLVEVDIAAQSKVMVNPNQMSANIYNPNSKVVKLSVPGLEIGDILRYVTHEVITKTVVPNTWSDYEVFEHSFPIINTTYEVIAPSSLPLSKIALKDEVPGTVTFQKEKEKDSIIYRWIVKDVPRMFDEPNMPSRYTVVQRLLISTIDSWEYLSKWYWDLCLPRLECTTPEMEAKALALVEGKSDTLEKIKAIFNFVSQDIRYMGITTEDEAPGYEPHDVKITFENRYGVCRDKAALLAAMLRVAGVEAFPVIIMAGPKKDEEVPQPFFNHAVTAALGDDHEYILMDSTDENTKDIFPSYLQNMSYIVARPEGETLLTSPVIPATDNLVRIKTTGKLDAAGNLSAESTLYFEGINDTMFRGYFSKIKQEERKRFFEGMLKKGMPTAELSELKITPEELRDTTEPLTIHLGFNADNLLVQGDEKSLLDIPSLGAIGYANYLIGRQTGLEKRKYPLYTRITAGVEEEVVLSLSDARGQLNIPNYLPIKTPQLTVTKSIVQKGNTLTYNGSLLLHTVEFSPDEYLTLKQNLKDMEYDARKKVILSPRNQKEDDMADIIIEDESNDIVLENASNWTETYQRQIKILTYAGKKKYADIKFHYNPAWQQIELLYANVIAPDGTVKAISDEEINIMDASWVASAPRYPAEKILVANLPGVEVGSVIDYKIKSTVYGKPYFSSRTSFTGFEPIKRKNLSITAPIALELRTLSSDIKGVKTLTENTLTYRWTAEDQPAVKKEDYLPDWWTFNPNVFISTSDWRSYANQVRTALDYAAADQPATIERAKKLITREQTDREKILALRNWVAENIRSAGPRFTRLPLSAITPADQTIKDGYANNSDRAVVLYALLKAAGFEPAFTLSGKLPLIKEALDPLLKVPSRRDFNAVLVKVRLDNETLYLTGSSQYAELGTSAYNRRAALELRSGNLGTVIIDEDKTDRDMIYIDIEIDPDGNATYTKRAIEYGTGFEDFHRVHAEITPEERRRYYLELVAGVSQSAKAKSDLITEYETYPGEIRYTVEAERYAVVDGDYLYISLEPGLESLLTYSASDRENPLAWNNYIDQTVVYSITLPKGYEPELLPEDFHWIGPGDAGFIDVDVETQDDTVTIIQQAKLKPMIIPASVYPGIIEAGQQWAHPKMNTILLRKK